MTDWPQVIRRHGDGAWKSACRLLGNEADAADCLQDAFLAAVQVARREPVDNWPGLLKRLVTVYGLRRLRQRRREASRRDSTADPAGLPGQSGEPAQRAEIHELAERLKNALAELPQRHAEVVCLHYLDEMSYEQIARELKISVNHVGVLMYRGRAKLRELLDPQRGKDTR